MSNPELKSWLALLRVPGVGPAAGARLLERFGDPAAALAAGAGAWRGLGLTDVQRAGLAQPDWPQVEQDLRWLDRDARALVTIKDPRYPARLREVGGAPLALFCQGDTTLLALPQLAIVGARVASPQGLENAKAFAAELARRGLVITSGLALGIDASAHDGALAADGFTIAVCGTGLDRVYPARHRELAHRITAQGLLVSEFPPGVPATPENFPRRNRIIAGLSLGVLVVEAARESGSLITARLAAEQGRDVFAIPGSIHNPMARGCHALIRQGAKLVESAEDILEELGPQIARALPSTLASSGTVHDIASRTRGVEPLQAQILNALGDEIRSVDALAERVSAPLGALQAALLNLELDGRIAAVAGGAYQRLQTKRA